MRFFRHTMLAFVILAMAIPLYGQLELGGVLDLNIATLKVQPGGTGEIYSSYLGMGIGVVVDYPLAEGIDLHLEPMVLQKGGKISEDDFSGRYKITYLDFPIMVRYTIPVDGTVLPYVMGGPNVGLRGNARFVVRNEPFQDVTDDTRFFDFGVGIGGGAKLPLDNNHLFAEARYVIGFVNFNRDADESTVKNRGLQVLVGITFPIGR